MKRLLSVLVVLALTVCVPSVAGASPSQWVKWNKHFDPLFDKMDTTYKQIGTDLLDGDDVQAETLFVKYSTDSIALDRYDNSPSKVINRDIVALSNLGAVWATEGLWYLTGQYPETESNVAANTHKLIAELNKFTHDINKYE
jgi:hypothetical protein